MDKEAIEPGQRRIAMVFGVAQTVRVLESSDYCRRQWLCTLEPAGTTLALDETELGELIVEPDVMRPQALQRFTQAVHDPLPHAEKLEAARQRSDVDDDAVTEASEESFPASDPPAWNSSTALASSKSAMPQTHADIPGLPKSPPRSDTSSSI
jgi:hypothetical protein